MELLAHQRRVTRLLLAATADRGFVLAGSGAIREHAMIDRPTEDVDLFTDSQDVLGFAEAVDAGVATLRGAGYVVEEVRRADVFARLEVSAEDGAVLEVDFAVDWREHPATILDVGPVLDRDDAVANKVGALFSPAEARDFLDVDAIRRTGTYSDEELLALAESHDDGFDRSLFAEQLRLVATLTPRRVQQYGVGEVELSGIQDRLGAWARALRG